MRTCYDSVNAQELPEGAPLYAGYVNGDYQSYPAIKARFPDATVIAISVTAGANEGDCLDVERFDATPDQAPGWVAMRRAAGHPDPIIYCSSSAWSTVIGAFSAAGVAQPAYWIAAYPGAGPSIPNGALGHQFADVENRYDVSVFVDYLPGVDPPPTPKPPPPPPTELPMQTPMLQFKTGQTDCFQVIAGSLFHCFTQSSNPGHPYEEIIAGPYGGVSGYTVVLTGEPKPSILDGSLFVTVEDASGGLWAFGQPVTSDGWGTEKLR